MPGIMKTGMVRRFGAGGEALTYADEVLADSPVAYYRLGESAGPTAEDSAGTADGTYNGSTFGQTGLIAGDADTAVLFDGLDDRVSIPRPFTATDNFTIEFWMKLPDLTDRVNHFVAVGNTDTGGYGIGMAQDAGNPGNVGKSLIWLFGGVAWFDTTYDFAAVGPHHIVFKRESGTLKPYVNNVLQTTSATTPIAPSNIAYIAVRDRTGTPTDHATATLDEVAFYNSVLSDARIAAHYAAGT
jgi:hypothetical protein